MDQDSVTTAENRGNFYEALCAAAARLPDKFIFFSLLAAWFLLFQFLGHCSFNFAKTPSLFEWMYNAYNTEALDSKHGQVIPFVVLALLWVRREALLQTMGGVWWPGLFLLAVALAMHLLGYFAQQPRLSIVAFYFGLYALCGLAWGRGFLRATFFPFILFAFAIPLGTFVEPLTFKLQLLAARATTWVTHDLLDIKLERIGTKLLDAHGTPYEVVAACSGIRSFFALLAITVIFAMLEFKSLWRRALIIFFTIPLAFVCNVLRLSALIVAAQAYGPKAGYYVHESFWIVTYTISVGSLFLVARWLREKPERLQP